jgi:small-conductance mechanosensitive channel/CRP-like cAMP-binding protein
MIAILSDTTWRLTFSVLLLVGAGAAPVLFPGRPIWMKLFGNIAVLLCVALLVEPYSGSPLRPRFDQADIGLQGWERLIEAGWWLVAARVAVSLTRLIVVFESRPRETQFLTDLLVGLIYLAGVLAIFGLAFSVHLSALLATSGVIAIVVGLALQSTLSDVFSGLAVGLERPFKPGDVLWMEGDIEGRVTQINWRSTHIITVESNIAIIPNSVIAKAKLLNRSEPTPARRDLAKVRLEPGKSVEVCITTLEAALKACRLPLDDPPPTIYCTGLNADGNEFEIRYSVGSSQHILEARSEVFSRVQRHLYHEGIGFAAAGVQGPGPSAPPSLALLLEQSAVFNVLDAPSRDVLTKHFTEVRLEVGSELIKEGEIPEALFVIASGTAEVTIAGAEGRTMIFRISPGESIGAIGLFTDSPVTSSAKAITPMRVYRLSRSDISSAVKEEPALALGMESLAKCGRAALRRDAAEPESAEVIRPELLLSRLRNFFHVLAVSR